MDCTGTTFFFSSRRRHTRSLRDWSSDVCSSDLWKNSSVDDIRPKPSDCACPRSSISPTTLANGQTILRSEERRVGKECRSPRSAHPAKRKEDIIAVLLLLLQ